jgi:O-antigen/teichoic acid export membrane protein
MKNAKERIVEWLRWSEQYTKTDMVYLAKGSFWSWFGRGIQIITGGALAIAFGNLLPQEVYGNYKYILSASGLLGAFTLNGLNKSIIRSVAQGYDGSLKQGVKAMIKWSGIITILAGGVSAYYFIQGNALLGSGMALIAIFQPIIKTTDLYSAQLTGKKLFKTESVYLTIQELVQAIALIGAMILSGNAAVIVATLFVVNAVFKSTYLHRTLTYYSNANQETDTEMVNFGKHLSAMRIFSKIAGNLDSILIFQLLGATPTAIFTFATMPAQKAKSFLGSLANVFLPKLSEKRLKTLQDTLTRKVLLAFVFSGLVTIAVILVLPFAFNLLLPAYTNAIVYAQWAALMIFFIPELIFSEALRAHAKKRALYIINISTNILKIVLLAGLIPLLGIWGAVYALIAERCLRTLTEMYLFYRAEPNSLPDGE